MSGGPTDGPWPVLLRPVATLWLSQAKERVSELCPVSGLSELSFPGPLARSADSLPLLHPPLILQPGNKASLQFQRRGLIIRA